MNLVSICGLLTLLLIAWGLSFHKKSLRLRPIFWGVALQLLFALIILRQDLFSFIGMGILGILIITYLLQKDDQKLGGGIKATVIVSGISIGLGAILCLIPKPLPWILALIILFCLLNGHFKWKQHWQRFALSALTVGLISYLISGNIHGQIIFSNLSSKVAKFLALSDYGAAFLFGNLIESKYFFTGQGASWPGFGFQFAFKVLPTIIFFGGLMSILYYLGIMQKVIESIGRFMKWTIGTSGAETLSCSANIFVGQTEGPLLIKPFLNDMTRSELTTVMIGGFATIAGGVMAGYIAMGIPAGHLIAASVMSAPAALVVGKIIYPELEHSQTAGDAKLPAIQSGNNIIEAATNGISDGFKLAANVGAMLIGFIALIALVDVILNWLDSIIDGKLLAGEYVSYAVSGLSPAVGEFKGYFPGSLQTLFGTIFRPLAFVMGVPWQDAASVGNLLGIKISLNEFVAYGTLGNYISENVLSPRSVIISTYALCGFANFASIGIQLGGISALAPNRKSDLAAVGLKAMFGGAIASWMTASIAGMFL